MIITLGGLPGAGSTTVARIVAEKLNYKLETPGEHFKKDAEKQGLGAKEFWEKLQKDKKELQRYHRSVDEKIKKIASKEKNLIINSKLAAFDIPNADIKIFLTASFSVRSKRVAEREGIPEAEVAASIQKREEIERKEWKELYGIDYVEDKDVYDYLINTDEWSAEEVAEKIISIIKMKRR